MVKTITIKDDVYKKLIAQKGKDESFSDLFERLVEENLHGGIDALKKLRGSIEFDKNVSTLGDLISALRSSKQYKMHLQCIRDKLSVVKYNSRDDLFGFVNLIRNWVFELGLKNDADFVRKCLINASTNKTIRKNFEEKSSSISDVGTLLETFYQLNASLDQCIKYGDTIVLKHVPTGNCLSSNTDRYSAGSKFQIVSVSYVMYIKKCI